MDFIHKTEYNRGKEQGNGKREGRRAVEWGETSEKRLWYARIVNNGYPLQAQTQKPGFVVSMHWHHHITIA
jgi:hypothetical protein